MAITKRDKTTLILAFITVFFDMMNYAIIVPILPYLVKELNSTSMQEGLLFSAYSVMQLISLLIMGPCSDIYGRRPFLLLSLFGSCFGSLFQGMSNSMWPLIFWRAFTGLFAGSQILVQAVVADVTSAEDRNKYLSRLDACISFAFIIGPAIGGILAQVNNHFPMYVAGVVSGIAMIVALIFLEESNPKILKQKARKSKKSKKSEVEVSKEDIETEAKVEAKVDEQQEQEEKPKPKAKIRVTSTMILCFIFEFCIRWTLNAFDSRYGIYITDKWGVSSIAYSTIVVFQSVFSFVLQAFGYPWIAKYLSIPSLATIGMVIQFVSYILMGAINNVYGNVTATFILWLGFCFASPTSASILTTTVNPEYQGTVLSWNNFCYSSSLIISPLVLSAIYPYNKEAIYYFSSIFGLIGVCIMGYVSTWPNAKVIGKKSIYKDETKSVELPELKVEKSVEEGAVVPQTTEGAPAVEGSSEEQTGTANSVPVESKPSENDQTPSKE